MRNTNQPDFINMEREMCKQIRKKQSNCIRKHFSIKIKWLHQHQVHFIIMMAIFVNRIIKKQFFFPEWKLNRAIKLHRCIWVVVIMMVKESKKTIIKHLNTMNNQRSKGYHRRYIYLTNNILEEQWLELIYRQIIFYFRYYFNY